MAAECRMRGCTRPRERDGFCTDHLATIIGDPTWLPVKSVARPGDEGMMNVCGFCGAEVRIIERIDHPRRQRVALEPLPHTAGRCELINGGFRVLTAPQAARLTDRPLYRAHGPICEQRPT